MKTPHSQAFIVSIILYTLLLSGGYWLFFTKPDIQKQSLEILREVPVSLSMFQAPPPTEKPKVEPIKPVTEVKPVVKPIVKPKEVIKPVEVVKPKPIPKPLPKPIETPIEKQIEKPIEQPIEKAIEPEAVETKSKQPVVEEIKPVAQPQFSQQQVVTAEQVYLNALQEQIALHASNTYPNRAKRRHWEGTVHLKFTLFANGQIRELSIIESSGRQILDDAATTILQSKMNGQFRPFPKEIQRRSWRITVPVNYNLRS